jgi:hypothetical protein
MQKSIKKKPRKAIQVYLMIENRGEKTNLQSIITFTLYTKHMIINMIAAMASNRIVGNKNQLPRHYSQDLQHFKKVTTGHIVVMGYNTFLSIGKPLPNRRNIILSRTPVE